jgi:ubiquinone/menaquinone biosynthesis C-methylase UbiE
LKDTTLAGWKEKRAIMQRYDATAEGYDELHSQEQKAKYNSALRNLEVTCRVVLDIGCGSGLFFQEVSSQAEIVVGIDISHKLLQKAKEHAKEFENVFVLQADADHLPFLNGSFNSVFAFTVLQNMPQPSETLLELKRIVSMDGRLVVTALKKAFALPAFMDLLEVAGFKVIEFVDDDALKCYVTVLVLSMLTSAT